MQFIPNLNRSLFLVISFVLSYSSTFAAVFYVDGTNGSNGNNGTSWAQAWKDIPHAIYWAGNGAEIWINEGTYYPTQNNIGTEWASRNDALYFYGGQKVYGGFSVANGATTMVTRNPSVYKTIISGEIQQDNDPTNNSFSIIRTYYRNGFDVLDGVTVEKAYDLNGWGGGIYLNSHSPLINNCIIQSNVAYNGGGIFNDRDIFVPSAPTITNCKFMYNTAVNNGGLQQLILSTGGKGGAIYNSGSSPTISNTYFYGNSGLVGAAICNFEEDLAISSPTITNCTFSGHSGECIYDYSGSSTITGSTFSNNAGKGVYGILNSSTYKDCVFENNGYGGLHLEGCKSKVLNCSFKGNNAHGFGGGLFVDATDPRLGTAVEVTNCLFENNVALSGGGIATHDAFVIITNCTFTKNRAYYYGAGIYVDGTGALGVFSARAVNINNTISYGNLSEPNYTATDLDLHVEIYEDALHVKSYQNRPFAQNSLFGGVTNTTAFETTVIQSRGGNLYNVDPLLSSDAHLGVCSRAINAGNSGLLGSGAPTTDLDGNPRISSSLLDLGCYEFQGTPGSYLVQNSIEICEGQSSVIFGTSRTESGTYYQVLTASNGCDSVIATTLIVNPLPDVIVRNSDNCYATGTIELEPNIGTGPFTINLNGNSNNIIHADSVLDFSSEYNSGTFAANKALGVPDVYPSYGDIPNTWASLLANGGREHISLRLSSAVVPSKLQVYETFNPGAIDTVYVRDSVSGDWNIVYSGTATPFGASSRIFEIDLTNISYKIDAIRLALNTAAVSGFNEIDAISVEPQLKFPGLTGGSYPYTITDSKGCANSGNALLNTNLVTSNIIYVDEFAGGNNDGKNWKDAFTNLQSALDLATCSGVTEIRVSKGTYYPTKTNAGVATTSKFASFQMVNGVKILGGFNVLEGDTTLTSRDWSKNKTTLSGEIQKDYVAENNAHNVIFNYLNGLDSTAILDGFTISDAYNTYQWPGYNTMFGGGIFNQQSSPSILNCIIENNTISASSNGYGAGMYNEKCSPKVQNCTFRNNTITASTYAEGAGIFDWTSNTQITNCTFSNNSVSSSNPSGAAIFEHANSNSAITNVLISENNGGGIVFSTSNGILQSTTIVNNTGDGIKNINSTPGITNTIIYGNTLASVNNISSTPVFQNSEVEGSGGSGSWNTSFGTDGGNNMDQSPLLNSDYTLSFCSPAIDAGNNLNALSTDLMGQSRISNGTVDLGCYESNFDASIYGTRVYVDSAATGTNSGVNWQNAFKDLQSAISISRCTGVNEIYVAKGTYFPSLTSQYDNEKNQFVTFVLQDSVAIYGGFDVNTGDTNVVTRNWRMNKTILSGEIQQDGIVSNNAYNVVFNYETYIDTMSVLNGFVITGASNNYNWGGSNISYGGGIFNQHASPKIENCIITKNVLTASQEGYGAGMYNEYSNPIVRNCTFTENTIFASWVAYGGAISNLGSDPVIEHCIFDNNDLNAQNIVGGGIYYSGGTSSSISNCLFTNNGGGAVTADNNNISIINSTIANNDSKSTAFAGGMYSLNCTPTITNSIFYGNSFDNISVYTSTPVINNSLVQSSGGSSAWNTAFGTDGGGNIDENPLFNADFSLSSCSPAIDAGNNTNVSVKDLNGNARVVNSIVDMGAYESNYDLSIYGNVIYVDSAATGTNDGTNWANAFTDLQSALTVTRCVSTIDSIFVSKGTYYPSATSTLTIENTQSVTFVMPDSVAILGGFNTSIGETTLATRDWKNNKTVLSGDYQKDGVDENNAYRIIFNYNNNLDSMAILDGFVITKAYNNHNWSGTGTSYGGGIFNQAASPKILNCIVEDNKIVASLRGYGAGIYNESCAPIIRNCTFRYNSITATDYAEGGGLFDWTCNSEISNCIFEGNSVSAANYSGAGIFSYLNSNSKITNALIFENKGGGVSFQSSNGTITNSTIVKNTRYGINNNGSNPVVKNSIIYENTDGPVLNSSSTPTFKNSLVHTSGGSSSWNVAFGTDLGNNIDANPEFSDGYYLTSCSPAIDAGTNVGISATDLDNQTRVFNGIVDLGCYEFDKTIPVYGSILYVDEKASGTNNGSSWTNAFTDLQSAISLTKCFSIQEIRVSKGMYTPSLDKNNVPVSSSFATFVMPDSVVLYGGFDVSNGDTILASRNWKQNETILSGEIQGDGIPSNNAYNVIFNYNTGIDTNAVLDGFVISDAYNTYNWNGTDIFYGGGIFNQAASPKITHCIIRNNVIEATQTGYGAGMYNEGCDPVVRNCEFLNNSITGNFVAYGAGIYNENSSISVSHSIFENNTIEAPWQTGSAFFASGGTLSKIDNCLIAENSDVAICFSTNPAEITNSTIVNNQGGALFSLNLDPVISNSILFGNTENSVQTYLSSPNFNNSIIEGSGGSDFGLWDSNFGIDNGNNIDADPMFLPGNFQLSSCSPARETGSSTDVISSFDLAGNNRINDSEVDMGCYESDILAVNLTPTSNLTICSGNSTTLIGSGKGNIIWYSDAGGTTKIGSGDTLITSSINSTTTFYMEDSTCATGGVKIPILVNVNPVYSISQSFTLCDGDSIVVGGKVYTQSGNYVDTLISVLGCDSIVSTQLELIKIGLDSLKIENIICSNGQGSISFQPMGGIAPYYFQFNGVDSGMLSYDTIWANSVLAFSSEYSATNWGVNRLLGPPDVYPFYGDNPNSWASGTPHSSREFVEVSYPSITATNVLVYETFNPGAIDTVYVRESLTNNWIMIYSDSANVDTTIATIKNYAIPDTIGTIDAVRLAINSIDILGYNEIDAIGLIPRSKLESPGLSADTYPIYIEDSLGCILDTNITLVNPPAIVTNLFTELCYGDTLTIDSMQYVATGDYTHVYTAFNGCDSTVTTHLTIRSQITNNISVNLCNGQSITIGGSTYNSTGNYIDTLNALNGCDSIVFTQLNVNSQINVSQSLEICFGETTSIGAHTYDSSGSYIDTLKASGGCDSIILTSLVVLPKNDVVQNIVLCYGDSLAVGSNFYFSTGMYLDTLAASNGCDSIVTTDLTVRPKNEMVQNITLCYGDSLAVGSNFYFSTGMYLDTLVAGNGCDSIVITDLIVRPKNEVVQNITLCYGDSIAVGNNYYSSTGLYLDTLVAISGCDSLVRTNLVIDTAIVVQQNVSLCFGEVFKVGLNIYDSSGVFTDLFSAANGCDSTVITNLTIGNELNISTSYMSSTFTINADASGMEYQWLDCNNDLMPIDNETAQTFTVGTNGSYAVEISDGQCKDTSACLEIFNVGVPDVEEPVLSIYPNPNTGMFHISGNHEATYLIKDALGRIIQTIKLGEYNNYSASVELGSSGVYVLTGYYNPKVVQYKIVVER